MIDALVAGRIYQKPSERTSKAGKRFGVAKVRAPTREGESIFINVIAFAPAVVAELLALEDGDAVAIAGELTPKVYQPATGEPRPSVDLLAHAVMSAYVVTRKRQAAQQSVQRQSPPFDDDLPAD